MANHERIFNFSIKKKIKIHRLVPLVETLGRESENPELERTHQESKDPPPQPEGQKAADHNDESE